jgi:hypothetical protein
MPNAVTRTTACRNIPRRRPFVLRSCLDPEVGCGLMEATMHGLIYLIGLIVVIMAILSFFGLR